MLWLELSTDGDDDDHGVKIRRKKHTLKDDTADGEHCTIAVLQSSTAPTTGQPVEPTTTKTTATATTAAAMPDHIPACSLGSLAKQPDAYHTPACRCAAYKKMIQINKVQPQAIQPFTQKQPFQWRNSMRQANLIRPHCGKSLGTIFTCVHRSRSTRDTSLQAYQTCTIKYG
jgi:hypothetical protein